MKSIILCIVLFIVFGAPSSAQQKDTTGIFQFIFTSDAHYGITRKAFRGQEDVDAHVVNTAMVKAINGVSALTLPNDGGLNAGKAVGNVDYLIEGGDIANRMEVPVQSAAASWAQFEADYLKGITLNGSDGKPTKFFMVPGNHDISDALGFYKKMNPATDPSSLVNIYNLMLNPAKPLTNDTYDYANDKINYSKNIGGIHFVFITLWPDSAERVWMEKDLQTVSSTTPVFIFTHDQPDCEAKHFTNPNPGHTINAVDKFENLLAEVYKDGAHAKEEGGNTFIEQRGWVQFLKRHPNIKAYFHGNSNFNEFYVYHGPDNDVALNVFRVDSPIKGKYSSKDETKLSFQLVIVDTKKGTMTVRECLWNTDPTHPEKPLQWGSSKTVSFL